MSGLAEFVQRLEKAELHLHLEGSIAPATLRELAPELEEAEIAARYEYQDFLGFLKNYAWVTGYLKTPDDYALITARLLADLGRQNVSHAELNLSVGVMLWRSQDVGAIFDAIDAVVNRSDVSVRYIFDAVRQFGAIPAKAVAELAVERMHRGVVGFGIGGDEKRGPAPMFRDVFVYAEGKGLKLVPHAGETAGPESIWQSLELGATRIGHGIRAIDDPVLMRYLRDHDIPLEISITSNLRTQAVRSLRDHPIRRLYDAGVPVTLNTDDPAMFHTTLNQEYELAAREFGFSEVQLKELAANSFRYSFKPTI